MSEKSSVRREPRATSDAVRRRIMEAAAIEFANLGFEGASTRSIAERAAVHQAQLGYHLGSKEELWRATLDFLFVRLRSHLDRALPESTDELVADPVSMFADVVRLHVRHTAKHPELSRIMLMEGAKKSPRSDWLLRHHVLPTLAALELVWADVRAMGRGRGMSAEEVFMLMVGLAPMPFAQAGIMRPLLGVKRCAPDVHAESMINWILG